MALTPRERAMVEEISARQQQLELLIGSMFGRGLGRNLVQMSHENPLNSPLVDLSQHNLAVASAGKKIGSKIAKKKRKVSGYQREFGRQLKQLKKKHPRTDISRLMKKAHIATRRNRK